MKCLYLTFGSRITIGSLSDIKNSKLLQKNARLIGAKTSALHLKLPLCYLIQAELGSAEEQPNKE